MDEERLKQIINNVDPETVYNINFVKDNTGPYSLKERYVGFFEDLSSIFEMYQEIRSKNYRKIIEWLTIFFFTIFYVTICSIIFVIIPFAHFFYSIPKIRDFILYKKKVKPNED